MKKPSCIRYMPISKENADFWEKYFNMDYNPNGSINKKGIYKMYRMNTTIFLKNEMEVLIKREIFDQFHGLNGKEISEVELLKNFESEPLKDKCKKSEFYIDEVKGKGKEEPYKFKIELSYCHGNEIKNKIRKNKLKYELRIALEYHIRFQSPSDYEQPVRDDADDEYEEIDSIEKFRNALFKRHIDFCQQSTTIKKLDEVNAENCAKFGYTAKREYFPEEKVSVKSALAVGIHASSKQNMKQQKKPEGYKGYSP